MNAVYIEHIENDRWRVISWDDKGRHMIYEGPNRDGALAIAGLTAPDEIRFVEPSLPVEEVLLGLKEILDDMEELVG